MTEAARELVARLRDEAQNLDAAGWDRGSQDASISGMLASDAADWIEDALTREADLRALANILSWDKKTLTISQRISRCLLLTRP